VVELLPQLLQVVMIVLVMVMMMVMVVLVGIVAVSWSAPTHVQCLWPLAQAWSNASQVCVYDTLFTCYRSVFAASAQTPLLMFH
jgi:Na+(H+)/acetate symporter ActP